MKSLGAMLTQLHAMVDTKDLNDWENKFVKSCWERSWAGQHTQRLTPNMAEKVEQIYSKHFGD